MMSSSGTEFLHPLGVLGPTIAKEERDDLFDRKLRIRPLVRVNNRANRVELGEPAPLLAPARPSRAPPSSLLATLRRRLAARPREHCHQAVADGQDPAKVLADY